MNITSIQHHLHIIRIPLLLHIHIMNTLNSWVFIPSNTETHSHKRKKNPYCTHSITGCLHSFTEDGDELTLSVKLSSITLKHSHTNNELLNKFPNVKIKMFQQVYWERSKFPLKSELQSMQYKFHSLYPHCLLFGNNLLLLLIFFPFRIIKKGVRRRQDRDENKWHTNN